MKYITEENKFESTMKYTLLYSLLALLFCFASCNTNDFREEYRKEQMYEGYNVALDTVNVKIYKMTEQNEQIKNKELVESITRWYDQNGYYSMSISEYYAKEGVREIVEKVTRDKYSLAVARDISVASPNTETVVSLSRLKKRKNGSEEWLFRNYIDPQKYLEDGVSIFYSKDSKVFKKSYPEVDTLVQTEIEIFDSQNRLISKKSPQAREGLTHVNNYYSVNGLVDSVVTRNYEKGEPEQKLLSKYTKSYKYELNDNKDPVRSYTYINDSLTYVSDYEYGIRN